MLLQPPYYMRLLPVLGSAWSHLGIKGGPATAPSHAATASPLREGSTRARGFSVRHSQQDGRMGELLGRELLGEVV